IDDDGRMSGRPRAITTDQDLTIWPDRHSLRRVAIRQRNVEGPLDPHRVRGDHCNDPMTRIWTIDSGPGDIELARPRTPLALLNAIGGFRGAVGAVERDLLDHRIGGG